MRDITRILCPTDLSPLSRHALDHAAVLARWYKAQLYGLYVHVPVVVPTPAFQIAEYGGAYVPPEPPDFEVLGDDVLAALRRATGGEMAVESGVRTGSPPREILAYAKTLPADLIVMGTHGASGFEHVVLGSVTEKVLRKAQCPVLTVPPRTGPPAEMPFKRILCPIDFSEISPAIVEFAASLADGASTLTLVHVLDWPEEGEPFAYRHFNVPEYRRYQEEDAASKMKALVSNTLGEGKSVTVRFAHGKPYREILREAKEASADIIVMGVQGRNALDVMLFGSTTNHVVRRALCPVLTLRQ